ncbi:hypothetical protein B2K_40365 [Paenibacillus mucilaginosus K02]|uniref:Uncharacterized protein n=1 Tax=Paenibacillus mucilaginosus K02 TaxID=997761 RepID=R9UPR2_9BACL|nr:hypothetical protein B2K_40365 [Paenibacillus mucilaginosus K02]
MCQGVDMHPNGIQTLYLKLLRRLDLTKPQDFPMVRELRERSQEVLRRGEE